MMRPEPYFIFSHPPPGRRLWRKSVCSLLKARARYIFETTVLVQHNPLSPVSLLLSSARIVNALRAPSSSRIGPAQNKNEMGQTRETSSNLFKYMSIAHMRGTHPEHSTLRRLQPASEAPSCSIVERAYKQHGRQTETRSHRHVPSF